MFPPFLKRDGDALKFSGDGEFIFYVPEKYFETKNAIIVGEYVNLLGILDYTVYDKNGKNFGLKQFKFPSVFLTKPYTIDKVKDVKLTDTTKSKDYRLLKYKKGDIIVVSVKVPKDVNNVEDFYNLMNRGNLPTTIPYNKFHEYPIKAAKLNGMRYGITTQLLGIIQSELFRSSKDERVPFRLSGSKDMTDYQLIDIRLIPKFISPYAALTSENWNESIVHSLLNTAKGTHKETPMEKIMMEAEHS